MAKIMIARVKIYMDECPISVQLHKEAEQIVEYEADDKNQWANQEVIFLSAMLNDHSARLSCVSGWIHNEIDSSQNLRVLTYYFYI